MRPASMPFRFDLTFFQSYIVLVTQSHNVLGGLAMQFETAAKIAGICVGIYASYKIGQMLHQARVRAAKAEEDKRAANTQAVARLIDDLDVYAEHVAKRIAILKSKLARRVITLEEYNIQLLELTH